MSANCCLQVHVWGKWATEYGLWLTATPNRRTHKEV